jgi:hypothetical protein
MIMIIRPFVELAENNIDSRLDQIGTHATTEAQENVNTAFQQQQSFCYGQSRQKMRRRELTAINS